MPFRNAYAVAVLTCGLFLAGCNSSDSPTGHPIDPDPDPDFPVNGTLTVDGKPIPAHISGLFDDTSLTLTVLTDLYDTDTGWSLMVESKPSQGPQPILAKGTFMLNATHKATVSDTGCVYSVKSGSANFATWTPFMVGSYEMARMTGTANVDLTRWSLVGEGCPDVSMNVSFTDAEAANINAIDGMLK